MDLTLTHLELEMFSIYYFCPSKNPTQGHSMLEQDSKMSDSQYPDWSKSHNGLMLCTFDETKELMPEVAPIINEIVPSIQYDISEYLIDVKVHMLMPEEYPCIPNWHCDFVPRDENKKKLRDKIKDDDMMYLWTSGAPYTEFKSYQDKIKTPTGKTWIVFNQRDVHRGVKSEIFTWRCFIRLIPKWFIHPKTLNVGTIRRHTQVYIENPEKFRW